MRIYDIHRTYEDRKAGDTLTKAWRASYMRVSRALADFSLYGAR